MLTNRKTCHCNSLWESVSVSSREFWLRLYQALGCGAED